MPRILVQAFRGRSVAQKRELVRRITIDVAETFDVPSESVSILIQESDLENFAKGGTLELDRQDEPSKKGGQ